MGIWYEGYGLYKAPSPAVPDFYQARRPWNLLRYSFNPTITAGKWSVPFNFNFSPMQNNFTTPSTSFSNSLGGGKQSVWQFLTNPVNNFGIRPKFGSTEILLGTQNLQYSDLSTGDLGVFGYGVNLAPGKFRIKLFNGVSQRPVNYLAPTILPPSSGVIGAYQRNQWMGQLGLEKEGKYFAGFNFVKSIDKRSSVTSAPLSPLDPQENMVVSFLTKVTTDKGYRNKPLTEEQKANNTFKSKTRARVEHVFGIMPACRQGREQSINGLFIRSVGTERATGIIGLINLTYNLFRYEQVIRV